MSMQNIIRFNQVTSSRTNKYTNARGPNLYRSPGHAASYSDSLPSNSNARHLYELGNVDKEKQNCVDDLTERLETTNYFTDTYNAVNALTLAGIICQEMVEGHNIEPTQRDVGYVVESLIEVLQDQAGASDALQWLSAYHTEIAKEATGQNRNNFCHPERFHTLESYVEEQVTWNSTKRLSCSTIRLASEALLRLKRNRRAWATIKSKMAGDVNWLLRKRYSGWREGRQNMSSVGLEGSSSHASALYEPHLAPVPALSHSGTSHNLGTSLEYGSGIPVSNSGRSGFPTAFAGYNPSGSSQYNYGSEPFAPATSLSSNLGTLWGPGEMPFSNHTSTAHTSASIFDEEFGIPSRKRTLSRTSLSDRSPILGPGRYPQPLPSFSGSSMNTVNYSPPFASTSTGYGGSSLPPLPPLEAFPSSRSSMYPDGLSSRGLSSRTSSGSHSSGSGHKRSSPCYD